ncbi:hypothetical protein [Aquibacillus albus]|uniref:Uncharacterized protein n=1 Tax=Aquibacillus albus TaxID=1168171 RepID=A0ABS2MVL2_9BACI|nr:hypothetical protein [Aquibacillus albus]MBM7569946.1 hypothetical protein [Aquibacillus albus]
MTNLVLQKTIKFFRSYGVKCDETLVEEWLNASPIREIHYQVNESDLYAFNDWCRWKGTAYEEGIDDTTKISRLLEEISELKRENSELKEEKDRLADGPANIPFL